MRYGECDAHKVVFNARGVHVGNSSFTIACEFRRAAEDALLARTETVYVMIDAHGKTPVPASIRGSLLAGSDAAVDHAGWRGRPPR